jgi:hypothetical protein
MEVYEQVRPRDWAKTAVLVLSEFSDLICVTNGMITAFSMWDILGQKAKIIRLLVEKVPSDLVFSEDTIINIVEQLGDSAVEIFEFICVSGSHKIFLTTEILCTLFLQNWQGKSGMLSRFSLNKLLILLLQENTNKEVDINTVLMKVARTDQFPRKKEYIKRFQKPSVSIQSILKYTAPLEHPIALLSQYVDRDFQISTSPYLEACRYNNSFVLIELFLYKRYTIEELKEAGLLGNRLDYAREVLYSFDRAETRAALATHSSSVEGSSRKVVFV